jgi:3-oxoacyl-[acyl-carrier-protein] synthase-3
MKVGLRSLAVFIPEEKVLASDYAHLRSVMPSWITMPAEKRRFPDPQANEIMAVKVSKDAIANAGLSAADIDLIICQSFGGRFIVPGLAGFVHKQIGCRRNTPAWNIQDICASFLDGCQIATAMIRADQRTSNVLVIAVSALETGGWGTDPSHPVASIMGDGGAAAVVSGTNVRGEFVAFNNDTYGEIYEPAVMAFDPPAHPELIQGTKWIVNKGGCGPHLTPEFDELFATVLSDMVGAAIGGVATRGGVALSSLDFIVAHQAFSGLLDIWKTRLEADGVSPSKWRSTWDKYGNVGAVDIPITLADILANEGIPPGSLLALFAPGGGGHTPAILMRWNG